jgi:hypothetical protein
MKKSKDTKMDNNSKKLKGNANKFYETIKQLSQEQDDDEIMLSEWEESVGFTMLHTKGIDIEPPHCVCGSSVKMPCDTDYSSDDKTLYTDKILELYENLSLEKDNDKKILIEQEIQDTSRRLDRDNHVFKAKINLTVFINRKTSKTVFTGSECRKKFIKMVFGLSKTSSRQLSKSETLMKQLEKKYKVKANNPKIYVFELFTLHYKSLYNHFEELKVDKRNYECRYKDLKHIETQIVEFLEQYGETVVKIEEMDIHKNNINLMRNMKGKWEEYLCELQSYIKFIEEMEREIILNKIINDKIEKYRKYQSKMNEKSKRILYIRRDVVSELNKQRLLLTNKLSLKLQPRIYNNTMKNLDYNTYLEIPYKNKDVFKSEFNGKYDKVNKLWYIPNYLYTIQWKKYILKYIGYEVVWENTSMISNIQTTNNTQINNIIFQQEERRKQQEKETQKYEEERKKREEGEKKVRMVTLLCEMITKKIEDYYLEEELRVQKERWDIKKSNDNIECNSLQETKKEKLQETRIEKIQETRIETCLCGIKLCDLCKCVNHTKSTLVKTKRKADNLRRCCECSRFKCKCK